jgi:hypothetical protein
LTTTDDTTNLTRGDAFEDIIFDDGNTIDDNLTTSSDIFLFDDGAVVDTNLFTTTEIEFVSDSANIPRAETGDDLISDDSNTSEKREKHQQRWESKNGPEERTWNFFSWTELNDLIRDNIIDSAFSSETVDISPNRHTVTDMSSSFSTVDISPNRHTITDTTVLRDIVTLPSIDVTDTTDVSDIVTLPSIDVTANTDITVTVDPLKDDINTFEWENDDWNFFEWGQITSLGTKTTNDSAYFSDPTVNVSQNKNTTSDTSNSNDSLRKTIRNVYWEQNDWNTVYWA